MRKHSITIIGLFLIAALTMHVISQYGQIVSLREQLRSHGAQDERFAALKAENVHLKELLAQNARAAVRPQQPTAELLRLRGQVARLNRNQAEVDEVHRQLEALNRDNRQLRFPTLTDQYVLGGFDSNSLPEIDVGLPREKVSAELRRVGARILSQGDAFVQAEVSSPIAGRSNTSQVKITMELYFAEGKLDSRRDSTGYSE